MDKFDHINQSNLPYIESLFEDYLNDPDSVDHDMRKFFEGVEFAKQLKASSTLGVKELNVYNFINAFRDYGHLEATLDPLGKEREKSEMLSFKYHGFEEKDLERKYDIGQMVGMQGKTLKEIEAHMRRLYCGTLSVQVASAKPEIRKWFLDEIEDPKKAFTLSNEQKLEVLWEVIRTESLEKFFHSRYVGAKRFSIEGADSMIPMLEHLVIKGAELGVKDVVIGMAHRGRINVLANFMDKALDVIFAEFDGHHLDMEDVDGDVKYHLGYSADKQTPNGPCHVSLAFNPSHLEAVCPVVCGMVRAKQRVNNDTKERKTAVPVQIHGDAAFAGQGVVPETLQLSQLEGYRVGGSIHIIVDNQIGFTADPEMSRSTTYSSDTAKGLLTPVIHVNGDDALACVRAMDMAIRFRQEFSQDIVIDLMCYRRHGHNESDEPAFTQPKMYDIIKKHPTLDQILSKELISESITTEEEVQKFYDEKINNLQEVLDKVREDPPEIEHISFGGLWSGLRDAVPEDFEKTTDTTMSAETLREVGQKIINIPEGFNVNRKLKRLFETRQKMVAGEENVDWGMAELLAYGSLLHEGTPVRLSGQDSVRGTFSHRQSCLYDSETGEKLNLLNQVNPEKDFCVYNSSLSEMAVLGFEYGNSSSDPTYLTMWEAQFGDFSNGAQIIIDQFLSSAETKWYRMSGLVLLLPHGYEGQGPEHSSARLERYLQLCAQENMQVCNFTTPSQMFHALRRQMKRDFRKPLIVMTPKSLLRHPQVRSSFEELSQGHFKEVIDDPSNQDPSQVKYLVLCTGKIYYDIIQWREEQNIDCSNKAFVRIEQLYPFPEAQLKKVMERYPNLESVMWAQEEPRNMGAWMFMVHKLRGYFNDMERPLPIRYNGRTDRCSPATGSPHVHKKEQQEIVEACFSDEFFLKSKDAS